ncbi:glutamyl-tRNA synthetase [Bisporella sp. PMI_857]|nr:glutamyl-tRNA synthetase [Bisporella sp. PMI_857]
MSLATPLSQALTIIDQAHRLDPNIHAPTSLPYELYYAQQMTNYLNLHTEAPSDSIGAIPSPFLRIACRAQHFRRWEVPRSSYPTGKAGYLNWRTFLKKRQAEQVKQICLEVGYKEEEAESVARLMRKEGLGKSKPDEVQILEDVACLVFLDDQFEGFAKDGGSVGEVEEEKMVGILQKTWAKMGKRGQELALKIDMGDECKRLVQKALAGDEEKSV